MAKLWHGMLHNAKIWQLSSYLPLGPQHHSIRVLMLLEIILLSFTASWRGQTEGYCCFVQPADSKKIAPGWEIVWSFVRRALPGRPRMIVKIMCMSPNICVKNVQKLRLYNFCAMLGRDDSEVPNASAQVLHSPLESWRQSELYGQ